MMPSPDMSFPVPLIHISETNSTNSYLQTLCAKQQGVAAFTTVVADFQTSGRGQRGNSWESEPKKNLLFSFVLFPDFLEARRQFLISQIVSLAIKEELDSYADDFSIKWPNDILYHGKKMVGILTEMSASMEKIDYIIMGIGINTGMKKSEFPEAFRETSTSFLNEGIDVSRKDLLAAILAELEKEYHIAQTEGFDKVLEDWKTLSVTLGQEVRVIFGNDSYTGKARDIDKDGCLLVDTGSHVTRVIAGDVSIRPIDAPLPKR